MLYMPCEKPALNEIPLFPWYRQPVPSTSTSDPGARNHLSWKKSPGHGEFDNKHLYRRRWMEYLRYRPPPRLALRPPFHSQFTLHTDQPCLKPTPNITSGLACWIPLSNQRNNIDTPAADIYLLVPSNTFTAQISSFWKR